MRYIAVGKDDLVNVVLLDQREEFLFFMDGDSVGIKITGQLRRIPPVGDIRDLSCSESNNFYGGIFPEQNVKIMKITSGSSHDKNAGFHDSSLNEQRLYYRKEQRGKALRRCSA